MHPPPHRLGVQKYNFNFTIKTNHQANLWQVSKNTRYPWWTLATTLYSKLHMVADSSIRKAFNLPKNLHIATQSSINLHLTSTMKFSLPIYISYGSWQKPNKFFLGKALVLSFLKQSDWKKKGIVNTVYIQRCVQNIFIMSQSGTFNY